MIVRLGNIINKISKNVDRYNTSLQYYIGKGLGECGELALTEKGNLKDDVELLGYQFQFEFQKGDTLFFTKSHHLRKAGYVDFDGVCSIATFVLRSKDINILLPEFLPIIIHNDQFWDYCIENESGSVNTFVRWSTLADYEFDLPSLDEQKVLADKLWAAYRVKESYRKLLAATDDMVKAKFVEMFGDIVTNSKQWETKPMSEVAPETASTHNQDGVVWNLNLDMIESNSGLLISKVMVPYEELNSVVAFDEGNVLYSKLRPYLNKVIVPDGKGYATTELVPLRPIADILDKRFLSYLLRSDSFVTYADSIATGTKMPRMPLNSLRKFPCILPPLDLQQQFVDIATQAEATKASLRQSIESIDRLIKSLINQ